MKIKDIAARVIQIAGLENEVSISAPGLKLNRIVDAINMIYSELTLEYVHLKTKENLKFESGRLYYSDFSKRVREVLSVKVGGRKIPFTMYPMYVESELDEEAEVTYNYYFGRLELDEDIILPPQYSEFVMATGAVSEYFYREGLVEEAVFYKNRYDTAIDNLSRRLKSVTLPERRFKQ